MPIIFLSPSLQEYNGYYDGSGSEKDYMNRVADEMEPYLTASGIKYVRNNPNASLSAAIADSNRGKYDLHLALHSNAAPPALAGQLSGSDFYYYAVSIRGKNAATVLADNFTSVYPEPSKVRIMPTTTLAELTRTAAPSVLVEIAYHDNPDDAEWIKNNITAIAANLVQGLCELFDIPFIEPEEPPVYEEIPPNATVITEVDGLNIRRAPSLDSEIIGRIPRLARCRVYPFNDEWFIVDYNGVVGFSAARYLRVDPV